MVHHVPSGKTYQMPYVGLPKYQHHQATMYVPDKEYVCAITLEGVPVALGIADIKKAVE